MIDKDIFKNLYDDFFGIEKLKRENEKLAKELGLNEEDIPAIELKRESEEINGNSNSVFIEENSISLEELKKVKDEQMLKFFERLEKLYITEDSKNTLKKIIEYMRKYDEKIEKEYISFNLAIYTNNKETVYECVNLISDAATFFQYVKKGYTVELSFYNLEKVDQVNDIYNKENSIILMKDFEGINSGEQNFKDKFWHRVEEKVIDGKKQFITILASKNREIVNKAFEKNEEIKDRIFTFEIEGENPDVQEVYQEILAKLKKNCEIDENSEVKLLDYITNTYSKTSLSFAEYRDRLCEKILFSKQDKITEADIPEYEKDKSMDEIFSELNELVGLEKIKQVLKDLVNLIELKNKAGSDLKIKDVNMHMIFLGNPGTGKTTVARIIAGMLYNLKYIRQNKLIEVSSKDLVAEYVGQTAPKTMAVIEKAMGGVLFIDEAYSLATGVGQGSSYNEEAIATLIQAMENYRNDLVVIFAGYTKEMQSFLNANSGIASRIGYTLEFEDYTEDELLKIFENMVKKSGFDITKEALNEARNVIREYKDTKNFGNARFARSLYEKTVIKHASNTKGKKAKKILRTIEKEDISTENLLKM